MTPRHTISHSQIATFTSCPRWYWWRYEMGIRPERAGTALRMGIAYHAGIEALNTGVSVADAVRATLDSDLDEPDRTIVACMVQGWAWMYAEQPLTILAAEQSFEIVVGETTIIGRIDAIVRLPDGRVAVQEFKTTREDVSPASSLWPRLAVSRQVALYIAGARTLGHEVESVVYDAARVPMMRPRIVNRTTGERQSSEAFANKLAVDMTTYPEWYFARREVTPMPGMTEESIADAVRYGEMIHDERRAGRWPRNTDLCRRWGECPYFVPCTSLHDPHALGVPRGYVVTPVTIGERHDLIDSSTAGAD